MPANHAQSVGGELLGEASPKIACVQLEVAEHIEVGRLSVVQVIRGECSSTLQTEVDRADVAGLRRGHDAEPPNV